MKDAIAVIPAAGRGTRLGSSTPKVFTEIAAGISVWDVLLDRLAGVVADVHLVLSHEGLAYFDARGRPSRHGIRVTTSVQREPIGMGDAVFGAIEHWRDVRDVLVLWGDQIGLSHATLARVIETQHVANPPALTLPLVAMESPYVHYHLNAAGRLEHVSQSREGDACPHAGRSDVGLFALSTDRIESAWRRYLAGHDARGARTGEINLLPFFAHLSSREGYAVHVIEVRDIAESRGLNTPEDLTYFRARLQRAG